MSNNNNDPYFGFEDRIILLAEGELDSQEREQLFLELDRHPGTWKACAMTVLQSQTLARSISGIEMEQEPLHKSHHQNAVASKAESTMAPLETPSSRWLTIAVSVAVLAAGFGSGWLMKPVDDRIVETQTPPSSTLDSIAVRMEDKDPALIREIQLAARSLPVADSKLVAFVGIDGTAGTEIYPIIRSPELQQQLLALPAPNVPQSVEQRLRKSGWQLDSRRHFVSLQLPNGKKKTVPINLFNYQAIGNETL